MAFQRVPDTAEIIVRGSRGGQEFVNTFYGQMDGGYTLADVEALATAVDVWCGASWLPNQGENYAYVRTDVRGLDASIDLEASASDNAGNGGQADSGSPNNACLAVKRGSGFTGRGARGRVYLPPPPIGAMESPNTISEAAAANFVTILEALDTAIASTGFLPVIVHRIAAGVPLAEAVVFTLVEWVVVDRVMDSMRRRLPARGV